MCNYSQYLVQKGKKEGREEGIEKGREEGREKGREEDKLEVLEQLEQLHFSDKRIMMILRIDAERLMNLRRKLQERLTVMAED